MNTTALVPQYTVPPFGSYILSVPSSVMFLQPLVVAIDVPLRQSTSAVTTLTAFTSYESALTIAHFEEKHLWPWRKVLN